MNIDKESWKRLQPLNNYIIVSLEQDDRKITGSGLVTINDEAPKNHFRLLRMSADCPIQLPANTKVFLRAKNKMRLREAELGFGSNAYLFKYSDIIGLFNYDSQTFLALGQRVLIRRRIETEINLDSKIIIPAGLHSKDQTLEGDLISYGYEWKGSQPVAIGATVVLTKWDNSHTEIRFNDGTYGLVVDEKFLHYIIEDESKLIEKP